MSRDIRQYWKEVRALEAQLPEFLWVVAQEAIVEFLTQVTAGDGAKLLHAKSHRLATDQEIVAHHLREAVANKAAQRELRRRSGAAVVVVDAGESDTPNLTRRRR